MSTSFSVIAERFRRAGQLDRAVALCREGLTAYPEHLSARVTLGCALLGLGHELEALHELQAVLKRAPDNLAAIRGMAELHARGIEEQDAQEMDAAEMIAEDVRLALNAEARTLETETPPIEAMPDELVTPVQMAVAEDVPDVAAPVWMAPPAVREREEPLAPLAMAALETVPASELDAVTEQPLERGTPIALAVHEAPLPDEFDPVVEEPEPLAPSFAMAAQDVTPLDEFDPVVEEPEPLASSFAMVAQDVTPLDEFDPPVAAKPLNFEIEDVLDEAAEETELVVDRAPRCRPRAVRLPSWTTG